LTCTNSVSRTWHCVTTDVATHVLKVLTCGSQQPRPVQVLLHLPSVDFQLCTNTVFKLIESKMTLELLIGYLQNRSDSGATLEISSESNTQHHGSLQCSFEFRGTRMTQITGKLGSGISADLQKLPRICLLNMCSEIFPRALKD
jgi:hypothetical protein